MALLKFDGYSFTYPDAEKPALSDINIEINEGEFVLLCGKSGSGKSTLLCNIKPETARTGKSDGKVLTITENELKPFQIGFVGQNPDTQAVMESVWHELAFGLENMKLTSYEIRRRIAETSEFFGITQIVRRKISSLSGGQKQLVNLAAITAMQPDIILLDEPTAFLDPVAAKGFIELIARLNKETGVTVILSTHNPDESLFCADKVILLRNGNASVFKSAYEYVDFLAERSELTSFMPVSSRIASKLGKTSHLPITISEGRQTVKQYSDRFSAVKREKNEKENEKKQKKLLSAEKIWFRYDRSSDFVLKNISIELLEGSITAVVGGNGSGKSTLLKLLGGAYKPQRGGIRRENDLQIALMPQNPRLLFGCESVLKELKEWQKSFGYTNEFIESTMKEFHLIGFEDRHPYDLSGGEMRRLALAKLTLLSPDVLLLDEPTDGMDPSAKLELKVRLNNMKKSSKCVLLVTHDIDFAADVSDEAFMLFEGDRIGEGGISLFEKNIFYTTGANRLTRGIKDGIIRESDVIIT